MPDRFTNNATSLLAPATHGSTVTPSDTLDLPDVTRAIYVGTAGAVAVRLLSGQSVVFRNVPAGSILPVRADRILAGGTTAADMVALA